MLSSPNPKEAKAVTVAEEEVTKFYLSDDISHIMPGMKDYVSVRGTNGQRDSPAKETPAMQPEGSIQRTQDT